MPPEQQLKPATDAGKIPTPQFPTEPPKEIKEMTFSIDPKVLGNSAEIGDSQVKIGGQDIKTEPAEIKKEIPAEKKEEKTIIKPPVEDKKVEDKKEEISKIEDKKEPVSVLKAPKEEIKSDKKEDKKTEQPKIEATQDKKKEVEVITPVRDHKSEDTFDYSPYTPQEQINLKNMSRQSREYTANLIKENKQLATLKDATYLQHEAGYTLSPEYRDLQQQNYFVTTEAQVWEQALLNIKAGKEFQDIVGFDQKTGQPILSKPIPSSDRDEIRVANNLAKCSQVAQNIGGHIQTFPNRFKQQIQTDMQAVEQVQKERFAWVANPKLLDYSVSVNGEDKKLRDVKTDFKNMLPTYWQNSPIADIASNLFVAMTIQSAELREARSGQQIAEIKKQEAARGEPSSDNVDSGVKETKINGHKVPQAFSLEGSPFERR